MGKQSIRLLVAIVLIVFFVSCQGLKNPTIPTASNTALTPSDEPPSVSFFDDFNAAQYNWPVGESIGEDADVKYQMDSGIYAWTVYSHTMANEIAWPDLDALKDFTVIVDARQKSTNEDECDYGIVYRQPDSEKLLSFSISNLDYSVNTYSSDEGWTEIIPWTTTRAIAPGAFNEMKMVALHGFFTVFVNGQKLTEFSYQAISEGHLGLGVDVFPVETSCEFEFDNFRVNSP